MSSASMSIRPIGRFWCVDEKSQIQALERTQPLWPLRPGIPARQTRDYKRNGATTPFAALDAATGRVIGDGVPRHRHQEFLPFLRKVDQETDPELDIHLIVDNYGAHKHEKVRRRLKRNRRFRLHFIPAGSSGLNPVERRFGKITDQRIRRGSFKHVRELQAAGHEFIRTHNDNPNPFVWTAPVERILEKIAKNKEALGTGH